MCNKVTIKQFNQFFAVTFKKPNNNSHNKNSAKITTNDKNLVFNFDITNLSITKSTAHPINIEISTISIPSKKLK